MNLGGVIIYLSLFRSRGLHCNISLGATCEHDLESSAEYVNRMEPCQNVNGASQCVVKNNRPFWNLALKVRRLLTSPTMPLPGRARFQLKIIMRRICIEKRTLVQAGAVEATRLAQRLWRQNRVRVLENLWKRIERE